MFQAQRAGGSPAVQVLDLHGKTRYQAELMIRAALRRSRGLYRIRLVHGHRSGTALRDFIRSTYAKHPSVLRIECIGDGATDLVLREM